MTLDWLSTEFVAGPVIGLLSLGIAYLAYRRGARADETAEENAEIAQVYAGYGGLLARLQEDNTYLRSQIIELRERLAVAEARIEDIVELRRKLAVAEERILELSEKLRRT